ncbi:MAG: immune inhibitor A [Betaproteobacteria bacterium]|nr:immune inhibitor A [Betaproteobacteria bacterium]
MNTPYRISGTLSANNYLTVPEDCRMGVCAHELGHLAFGWDDFYDPNYAEDGSEWDGSGIWDLMAGGSWNNGGLTPAHPAGLHKSQHPWLTLRDLTASKNGIVIPPYGKTAGMVVRIKGRGFSSTQWLILENRRRTGFDRALPGEGLLVWRVDTKAGQVNATKPAMLLVQADDRHDLENPNDSDAGDPGDPFPGSSARHELGDIGLVSTSFPGQQPSGVSLRSITLDASGNVRLDVIFA